MDYDWSLWNFLNAASEVMSKRKTFLNFDPRIYYDFYNLVILFKSCVAGYGMAKILPKQLTYTFLGVQLSLHFLIPTDESFFREMYNFMSHTCMRLAIEEVQEIDSYAYILSFLNVLTWFYNSRFTPSEFFLDCFCFLVVLYYIWKSYRTKPHQLSTLVCVLFLVNWLTDYISSKGPYDTLTSIIFYYIPLVFMDTFNTGNEIRLIPCVIGTIFQSLKLKGTDIRRTPAARFVDSLNIEDWGFTDYLDAVDKRKSFLNVDVNEHCGIFYILLLLKSCIASYAVRYVIGIFPTLKLFVINFLFSICDNRNLYAATGSLIRFLFISGYQYVIHFGKYPLALSVGSWYFVCCDNKFHFLLDFYLIVSALIYIDNAYRNTERIYSLLWFLYIIDWFADKYVGEPLTIIATIATLYLPVALITSCTAISRRTRIFSMLVFIALWLVYKYEKDNIENGVDKCILNFYEIAETSVMNLFDLSSEK